MGKHESKHEIFEHISNHFELGRVIGKGAFGKVHAICRNDIHQLYALKILSKRDIIEKHMVSRVIGEKEILSTVNFPFIVNLRFAFQTHTQLCMIVDLMIGGDLRYHLEKSRKFPIERVRFYATQIILALEYLHSQNIIHRDIKPENMLLDGEGYCHLTDFNISVKLEKDQTSITGVSGTTSYIAPEVLSKGMYNNMCDWFSLGVSLYEMYSGSVPWTGTREERKEAVLNFKVSYSGFPLDFQDLLQGLICPVENRLDVNGIKKHPFFQSVDWDAVLHKREIPPFVPNKNKANVDGTFDLEEQFQVAKKETLLTDEEQQLFEKWNYLGSDPANFKPSSDEEVKKKNHSWFHFQLHHDEDRDLQTSRTHH